MILLISIFATSVRVGTASKLILAVHEVSTLFFTDYRLIYPYKLLFYYQLGLIIFIFKRLSFYKE